MYRHGHRVLSTLLPGLLAPAFPCRLADTRAPFPFFLSALPAFQHARDRKPRSTAASSCRLFFLLLLSESLYRKGVPPFRRDPPYSPTKFALTHLPPPRRQGPDEHVPRQGRGMGGRQRSAVGAHVAASPIGVDVVSPSLSVTEREPQQVT